MSPRLALAVAAVAAATTTACTALFPFEAPSPSDPGPDGLGEPCLVGEFDGAWVDDVAVVGDYALLASRNEVLKLDVSVPAATTVVDAEPIGDCDGLPCGDVTAIAALGSRIVVVTDVGAAVVLNEQLARDGYVGLFGEPMTDVTLLDASTALTVHHADGDSHLLRIDLESVTTEGGAVAFPGLSHGLAARDGLVAVTLGFVGVVLVPEPGATGEPEVLDTAGDAVAVAAGSNGWLVADTTRLTFLGEGEGAEPQTILDRSSEGLEEASFLDVVIVENLAVVAAGDAGLLVVDPRQKPVASFVRVAAAAPALRLVVQDGRAYVARGNDGLAIVELDCAAP